MARIGITDYHGQSWRPRALMAEFSNGMMANVAGKEEQTVMLQW